MPSLVLAEHAGNVLSDATAKTVTAALDLGDKVHVLVKGRILESGGPELALTLEREGYDKYLKAAA